MFKMSFEQTVHALRQQILTQADPRIREILQTFASLPIHPAYHHTIWLHITPEQWVRIQPSLVIATHLLTLPRSLDFWHGLLFYPKQARMNGDTFDTVYDTVAGNPLPPLEVMKVSTVLNTLPEITRISFKYLHEWDSHGVTITNGGPNRDPSWYNGLNDAGQRSEIFMPLEHLQKMETASPDDLLRLWLGFAISLVHEMGHAMWMAVFGTRDEPRFRDEVEAEIGEAWEKYLFGVFHYEYVIGCQQIRELFREVALQHGVNLQI